MQWSRVYIYKLYIYVYIIYIANGVAQIMEGGGEGVVGNINDLIINAI